MTDIYDFRDDVFKTYKSEWCKIFKAVWKYVEVKRKAIPIAKFFNLFKEYSPCLWNKCSDTIIYDFIFRALQISYHELVYIPTKNNT